MTTSLLSSLNALGAHPQALSLRGVAPRSGRRRFPQVPTDFPSYTTSRMQFLALTRRRTESFSDVEFTSRVPAEVSRARALYAEGFIRQVWHRTDLPGACL